MKDYLVTFKNDEAEDVQFIIWRLQERAKFNLEFRPVFKKMIFIVEELSDEEADWLRGQEEVDTVQENMVRKLA